MVIKKNKSRKKPSRPIRYKKPIKTIKKRKTSKQTKQKMKKKRGSRSVKKKSKKVNVMKGGGDWLWCYKLLIFTEDIREIKELTETVLFVPEHKKYNNNNNTVFIEYKGFKIYHFQHKYPNHTIVIEKINKDRDGDFKLEIVIANQSSISEIKITYDETTRSNQDLKLYYNYEIFNYQSYKIAEEDINENQVLKINNNNYKFHNKNKNKNFADFTYNLNIKEPIEFLYEQFVNSKLNLYPNPNLVSKMNILNFLFDYDGSLKNIDFTNCNNLYNLADYLYYMVKPTDYYFLNNVRCNFISNVLNELNELISDELGIDKIDFNNKFIIYHTLIECLCFYYPHLKKPEHFNSIKKEVVESIKKILIKLINYYSSIETINYEAKYNYTKKTIYNTIKPIFGNKNKEIEQMRLETKKRANADKRAQKEMDDKLNMNNEKIINKLSNEIYDKQTMMQYIRGKEIKKGFFFNRRYFIIFKLNNRYTMWFNKGISGIDLKRITLKGNDANMTDKIKETMIAKIKETISANRLTHYIKFGDYYEKNSGNIEINNNKLNGYKNAGYIKANTVDVNSIEIYEKPEKLEDELPSLLKAQ